MAYVTRPALIPADFGYPEDKVEKPKPKPKDKPKKKTKSKVSKKKKLVKKLVVKVQKKGRTLPWKV